MLARVKGIMIDYDNTLLDQKSFMLDKLEQLQATYSPILPNKEKFLGIALELLEEGRKHDLFLQIKLRLGLSEKQITGLVNTYKKIVPRQAWLYPDVWSSLERLQRLGLRLAILSDDKSAKLQQKIDLAPGFVAFWEFVYSCKDMGEAKPHPSGFHGAAKQMGLPEEALIMVGDHLYRDVKGAIDAGYAGACWLNREDGFYRMRNDIFSRTFPKTWKKCIEVGSLSALASLFEDAHELNHSV
ncbi:MAG: HAD family hydrolase [Bacteroidota bacterium]